MKKHINKPNKLKSSPKHSTSINDPVIDGGIEQVANDLDTLARKRLPDGVLRGELRGYEAEIRQDSVLLALAWYLKSLQGIHDGAKYSWIPARALAHAMRIQKRDLLKALGKSPELVTGFAPERLLTTPHPAMVRTADWSASTIEAVVLKAIRSALRERQISSVNALIAIEVLVGGASAIVVAEQLGMTRSNVYQHLQRTRRITREIIQRTEVTLMDPM